MRDGATGAFWHFCDFARTAGPLAGGVVLAMLNATRQTGSALGVAFLGAIISRSGDFLTGA
jgi:hypothetical protein